MKNGSGTIRNRDGRGGEEDSKDVLTEEESHERFKQIQELIQEKGSKKHQQSYVRTD